MVGDLKAQEVLNSRRSDRIIWLDPNTASENDRPHIPMGSCPSKASSWSRRVGSIVHKHRRREILICEHGCNMGKARADGGNTFGVISSMAVSLDRPSIGTQTEMMGCLVVENTKGRLGPSDQPCWRLRIRRDRLRTRVDNDFVWPDVSSGCGISARKAHCWPPPESTSHPRV
jgi:hypothetical protein